MKENLYSSYQSGAKSCKVLAPGYCLLDPAAHRAAPRGKEEESRSRHCGRSNCTEPEGQPVPAALAPTEKKKSKTKSVRAVSDEEDAGSSQPEKETGPG